MDNNGSSPERLKEMRLIKEAMSDDNFRKIFMKGYKTLHTSPARNNSKEVEKILQRQIIQTDEHEYFQKRIKNQKTKSIDISFPNTMRISSNIERESIYNIRNLLRQNRIFHNTFKPNLETIGTKKFLNGVYSPNQPDSKDEIMIAIQDYAFKTGNYKDQSVKLYEIFNREELSKTPKEEEPLNDGQIPIFMQTSPKQVTAKLMKDLRENALLFGFKKMTAQKLIEIRDYVDSRMELWEPDLNQSLELQVKKIEELLNDGYTFEINDKLKNDKNFQRIVAKLLTKKDSKSSHNASFINHSPSVSTNLNSGIVLPSINTKGNQNYSGFNTSMSKDYPNVNSNSISVSFRDQDELNQDLKIGISTIQSSVLRGGDQNQTLTIEDQSVMVTLRDSEIGQASTTHINPFKKREIRSLSKLKPKSQNNSPIKLEKIRTRDRGETPQLSPEQELKSKNFKIKKFELKQIIEQCSPREREELIGIGAQIEKIKEEYDGENEEISRCLDIYQEQLLVGLSDNKLQNIAQIQENKRIQESDNYDNFLSPEIIAQLKSSDKKRIQTLIKSKKKKLWKPNRLELNRTVKNMIDKSEVQ
ncbi:UNKNOWN [Stylonychia lemnae]|uniref:Uncharacterized protein n=1 Tax=Stylonychia lemnae TaxID=5949 RepID=A0A078AW32_STYLE|nr:UNKNOWN [Stylonychia lemnae]|eukprot:CDW84993.1 UNKNOWN [Stylonychia lemnae]